MKRWLVTDPFGIKHHVELDEGVFYGTANLPRWVEKYLGDGFQRPSGGFTFERKNDEEGEVTMVDAPTPILPGGAQA